MSHDVEIRMLSVCIIREEKRKEMLAGRRDTYTRVLAISWFKVQLVSFVGSGTQNGAAFILPHYQAPHERQASRRDLVLVVRTVYNAGCCFGISYHFCRSNLVHLGAN
jgi:hypothetical protein